MLWIAPGTAVIRRYVDVCLLCVIGIREFIVKEMQHRVINAAAMIIAGFSSLLTVIRIALTQGRLLAQRSLPEP